MTLVRTRGSKEFGGVGAVQTPDNPAVSRAINDISEFLRSKYGSKAAVNERSVTFEDLNRLGFVSFRVNGQDIAGGGGLPNVSAVPQESAPSVELPSAPGTLVGTGAATVNILQWPAPTYIGHAYTEVYKNSVDNLSTAVLAGRATGRLFSDRIGSTGVQVFYWVRFVNDQGQPGPYNAAAGLLVETGTATAGQVSAAYDLLIVDKGVIVEALIGDAEIGTAKIKDLAVTDAKINSLAVDKLSAGSIAAGQYIQSSNYAPGSTGFRINADGSAEFRNIVARGDVQASSVAASMSISAPTIVGGSIVSSSLSSTSISAASITGGTITGATLYAGIYYNTSGSKYLWLDAPNNNYLLFTPNAKIFGDGRTEFSNEVASGTKTFARAPRWLRDDPGAGDWGGGTGGA
jgi:hypothetical protein